MKSIQAVICFTIVVLLLSGCQRTSEYNTHNTTPNSSHQTNPSLNVKTEEPSNKTAIEKTSEPKQVHSQPKAIIPNQVWVPSVGIKAKVQPVGLLENGQMDVPKSSDVAGIFVKGVLPGEKGNALMAGHLDNYTGPAIFHPLKRVKPGDPIVISNEEGKYLVFSVIAVESYLTAEAPLEKIFGDTDLEQLNLITCAGKYDRKKREHNKRLVVYTRLLK